MRTELRFVLAQPRHRPGRAAALMAGVLVATTGFTVLMGSTATARLQVTGTVAANAQAAYDILVRPKGARSPWEQQRGLVSPNYLAGQYGGITLAHYHQIQQVTGVAVAAPIAMVGYARVNTTQNIDITDLIDRTADEQVIRITPTWRSDRGLTVVTDAPQFVYLSRRPLTWASYEPDNSRRACASAVQETLANGTTKHLCNIFDESWVDGLTAAERTWLHICQALPDGAFRCEQDTIPTARLVIQVQWPVAVQVAAIDPAAEAALVGLDSAVVSGRYLSTVDSLVPDTAGNVTRTNIPLLAASTSYVDQTVTVQADRLGPAATAAVSNTEPNYLPDVLGTAPASARQTPTTITADKLVGGLGLAGGVALDLLVQAAPPSYTRAADGVLVPAIVPSQAQAFRPDENRVTQFGRSPIAVIDPGFRALKSLPAASADKPPVIGTPVGVFDPGKLRGFSELSQVPMETYQAPTAAGADARSRALLGNQPLQPDGSPSGYLSSPPLLFTTLAALPALYQGAPSRAAAPLSAIRIRVAGVHGFDAQSRERVRRVAEDIATRTGLDVDITLGSSPSPQTVDLAAGAHGRPELRVTEAWTRKGVAALIITAIDRKSEVLFGLILLVCALFLANGVSAAVRDRRRELALLACVGWPRSRLAALVATEVGAVGTVAGLLAAAVSVPLGHLTGVGVPVSRALLAVPAAMLLSLAASAVPALRAARTDPVTAVVSLAAPSRRARHHRGIAGMAVANLRRTPGRTGVAVTAVAVGVAGVTLLSEVVWAFHGTVTGSLLGDAVSVRVRGVDAVAVATVVLLGMLAVADVLYLNIRDRAAELATLRATGWSGSALAWLITGEGAAVGLAGGLIGAAIGLGAVTVFAGGLPAQAVFTAVGAAAGGAVLATISALVPAQLPHRLPVARLLAEE